MGYARGDGTYGIDRSSSGRKSGIKTGGRDAGLFMQAIRFIEDNRDVPFYVNI